MKARIKVKLKQFREDNLKSKVWNSFKDYLKSADCAQYKKARQTHRQSLFKKVFAGMRSRMTLSKLQRAIVAKNKTLTRRAFFAEWIRKKQLKEDHRRIMETMGASKVKQIFKALKSFMHAHKEKTAKQKTAI